MLGEKKLANTKSQLSDSETLQMDLEEQLSSSKKELRGWGNGWMIWTRRLFRERIIQTYSCYKMHSVVWWIYYRNLRSMGCYPRLALSRFNGWPSLSSVRDDPVYHRFVWIGWENVGQETGKDKWKGYLQAIRARVHHNCYRLLSWWGDIVYHRLNRFQPPSHYITFGFSQNSAMRILTSIPNFFNRSNIIWNRDKPLALSKTPTDWSKKPQTIPRGIVFTQIL